MVLLIALMIISIPVTIFFWIWIFGLFNKIEKEIGSRNFYLLSLAWWWSDYFKKK